MASPCGAAFKALGSCAVANEVCASDGTSDTAKVNSGPCKTQSDAFNKCFQDPGDGG